jgi:glycyl-tRNA synthetase beta chain
LVADADQAAQLAKTDLVTDMVGEFPELQGIMGGYYALNDGLGETVAHAIEDHYKPRFAGDALPRNTAGVVVALADKLETLVGMFGIGNLPTGDRDPFALRRHALGVIRMLVEKDLPLDLSALLAGAVPAFGDKITDASAAAGRLHLRPPRRQPARAGLQRARGGCRAGPAPAAPGPGAPAAGGGARLCRAARSPRAGGRQQARGQHPEEGRGRRPGGRPREPRLLQEQAEKDLYAALQRFVPEANAQFDAGDYTASLQTLAVLRAPVDAFFDDVMVNAEQLDLRLNRQGLLKSLHEAMNRVADLSRAGRCGWADRRRVLLPPCPRRGLQLPQARTRSAGADLRALRRGRRGCAGGGQLPGASAGRRRAGCTAASGVYRCIGPPGAGPALACGVA